MSKKHFSGEQMHVLECPLCNFESRSLEGLCGHIYGEHSEDNLIVDVLKCIHCDCKSTSSSHLADHCLSVHGLVLEHIPQSIMRINVRPNDSTNLISQLTSDSTTFQGTVPENFLASYLMPNINAIDDGIGLPIRPLPPLSPIDGVSRAAPNRKRGSQKSLRQATEVKATNASLDIMASVSAEVGAELLAEAGNQTDGLGDVSCPFCSRVFASTSSMRIHASLKHWRAARPAATIQQPGLVSVGFGPTGQLGHFSALSAAAAAAAAAASAAAATCQQQPLQHEGRFIITSANSAAAAVVARQSHLMQLQQQQPSQQISIDFASAGHGLANLGIVGTNSVPAISGQVASGGILPLATPTVYPCLPCHIGFGRRLGLRGHLVRVHGISRRSVDSYIDSIISRSVGLSLPSGELVLSGQTPSVLAAPAISCSTSTSTAFAISAASSSTSSISSLSLPIESGIVGLGANVLAGLNDPGPLHSVLTGSLCSASGGAINQAVVSAATTTAASAAVSASLVMALNELEATAATSAGSQAGLIAVTTTDGENGNREVMRSGVPCSVIDEATSVGLRTAGVSDIPPSPSRVPRALAH